MYSKIWDQKEKEESLVHLENRNRRYSKLQNTVQGVLIIWWLIILRRMYSKIWDQTENESLVHLENREQKDHRGQKALRDHQEKRVKKDNQGLQDIQEDQVIRVTKELKEEMVH